MFSPYSLEVRRGIDFGERSSDAGVDVGDVLLMQRYVVATAEPAEVPTDVVLPAGSLPPCKTLTTLISVWRNGA